MIDRFETFAVSIGLINRYVHKIKTYEMRSFGLKGTHVMCLYNLGRSPDGLTASELCDACGEDKAAISRTLGELAEKKLIAVNSCADRRAYRTKVVSTEKGRETISRINARISEIVNIVGGDLGEDRREEFYKCLVSITDNLESYVKKECAGH